MPKWILILILLGAGVLIVSALNSTTGTEPPPEPARLPTPNFDWEPAQPKTEQTIVFTTDFSDPNDVVSAYRWSFGDGSGSDRSFVQHSYDDEGSYRVCLTIRDAQGRSEQECQQIRVQGRNKPPEAAFHWQPTQPDVGQTIQFISDASDPEGQLSSYQWDLGDGTSKTSASFSYAYGSSGTYRVCLSVRDAQGLSNSTCRSLKVGPNKTGFIIPP
ncbi:MAG: PKD domain-containing protein, partial [Salinibacter sp.]